MFCEKCGTKNKANSKFCEKCGHALVQNKKIKKKNELIIKGKEKISKMPKKKKIITIIVFLIIIAAIITLFILLNNPLKKVEDSLESYYANYTENNGKEELIEIGEVLKNNKEDKKVLEKIKKSTQKAVEKWVKNFNTDYNDIEALDNAYKKLNGALSSIYNYYNGLEYVLDYELYNTLYEETNTLYYSKKNYLEGEKYEKEDNDYYAYYYYQKVSEIDNYYTKAQEYVNKYVKEELETFKENVNNKIKTDTELTNKEILANYLEQLEYINDNKTVNNIDLSNTDEYKNLYKDSASKVAQYTKKVIEELEKDLNYNDIIEVINESLEELDNTSEQYNELSKLKETYEDKLPDSLLSKYLVSSTWGSGASTYEKEINKVEYDSNLYFEFEGENQSRVYRLNGEYKKFKTTIVRGPNWDKEFTGYFVITGDDKELYKSDAITKSSELEPNIEIDVTGIDDLKIEFVTKSEADGWDSFYIYLVEPYLYK